jgi:hypothetical protein
MRDRFYTPPEVAAAVADAAVGKNFVGSAADFAIGAGALMEQLALRCPDATFAGTDIDVSAVQRLKLRRPHWSVSRCDFLNPESRRRAKVTRENRRYDAIALNPPFSHRGGATISINLSGKTVACSPAAAFVGVATTYTHPGSRIAALIPKGSLTSEKDSMLWEVLRRTWSVQDVQEFGRGWLPGTNTAAALVTLVRSLNNEHRLGPQEEDPCFLQSPIRLIRGCTPMFKVRETRNGVPLIHTTGMRRDGLVPIRVHLAGGRQVSGPAVLLPRVGQPVPWKIMVYRDADPLQLSDCVIALGCSSLGQASQIAGRIKGEWDLFCEAWTGSCAPYVTVGRLQEFLGRIGIGTYVPKD